MPGFLLHTGAGVQCTHMAPGSLQTSNTRVFVGSAALMTAADLHTVSGCPFTIPGPKPQPCVTIRWTPASRVFVIGQPAVAQVLGPGQGVCQSPEQIPQGPPIIVAAQPRVVGV